MNNPSSPVQKLLSLPAAMARELADLQGCAPPEWFAASDPEGRNLGSGGGTAHLLVEAWRATGAGQSLSSWLRQSRKLIIHGGGQSRRLPAYAAVGKPFIPIPVLRRSWGQRLDQTLMDFQLPPYERVLESAPAGYPVMITSGDVLLRFGDLPANLPDVDVLALGMPVEADVAQHFGVFFTPSEDSGEVTFFLQKPSVAEIRQLSDKYRFLVDTGMWLLSERAIGTLLRLTGWNESEERFGDGVASYYELYSGLGLSLGKEPRVYDEAVAGLRCAVLALPDPEFYHLGTSRQLIESVSLLQNRSDSLNGFARVGFQPHPDQYTQNAVIDIPIREGENHTLWIENATISSGWEIASQHVLTGIPDNDWKLALEPGVCLDFAPVGERDWCVRAYGIDDAFAGRIGDETTLWLGRPACEWLEARGLTLTQAGIDPDGDIQRAPLFPTLSPEQLDPAFIEWLFAARPEPNPAMAALWQELPRLSARDIAATLNLKRLYAQRLRNREGILSTLHAHHRRSVFFRLDLDAAARSLPVVDGSPVLPPPLSETEAIDPIKRVQDEMFRSVALRAHGRPESGAHEAAAFGRLRRSLLEASDLTSLPVRDVLEDQIIWGRSPARLDLAGGWTDTAPYCLQHGGRVVNVAVDLNGQPPVQVFVRPSRNPELVIRSIDLGVEERIDSYEKLDTYACPGSEFALAKAALALAGFLPRFHANGGYRTLKEHLEAFGGGIEISMMVAIPAGSGLGTSSILAGTLLATLSDLCSLGWDRHELVRRTLVLEQMLTTGGGWQDTAGGLFRGIKMIETRPGLTQELAVRWLPEHLFAEGNANRRMLLYYTGLTRMAKNILQDIVRGMFLNSARVLPHLQAIGENADQAFRAIQRGDFDMLCDCVRRSWELNQRLDAGTNPPPVQAVWDRIGSDGVVGKLLGAGGGGYLLLMARDEETALRVRDSLTRNPPNARARFVDLQVSQTGLQVTRS